jgi:hypothetical protein
LFCIKKKDEKDPVKADLEIKKKKIRKAGNCVGFVLIVM